MSKLVTVILPHTPIEFKQSLDNLRPPYLSNFTSSEVGKGIVDLELTFSTESVPPQYHADFARDCKATMLMALIIFYEAFPMLIDRILIHLISHKVDDWRTRADDAKEKKGADSAHYLKEWFLHDLIVQGGDLMGIDHRPCWDAGKCTHDSGGK